MKSPTFQNNPGLVLQRFVPLVAALGLIVLTGCESTGLSRREGPGTTYPALILSLPAGEPGKAPEELRTPVRLAVAQIGETAPPQSMIRELEADRALVASVVSLPLGGESHEYFPRTEREGANSEGTFSRRMTAIRNLAGTLGAEYVFVFGGSIDSWRVDNPLKVLDLTIVGGVVLPGTKIKLEGKGAGALVDVRSGKALFLVSAESGRSAASPTFLADGKDASLHVALRDELTRQLTSELLRRLAQKEPAAASSAQAALRTH